MHFSLYACALPVCPVRALKAALLEDSLNLKVTLGSNFAIFW